MASTMDDPNHLQIIEWVVGIIVVVGGSMLEVVRRLVKNKTSRPECDLIHRALTERLDEIKEDLKENRLKMNVMGTTLTEISTTLKLRSQDETERYMKHSKGLRK